MSKDEGLLATDLIIQTSLIHLLNSCQKFCHVSLYNVLPYPLKRFPQDIYEVQIYFSFNTRKYEEILEINPCLRHHDWKMGSFLSPQECWLTRKEESIKYVKWTTHAHFLFSSLLTIYSLPLLLHVLVIHIELPEPDANHFLLLFPGVQMLFSIQKMCGGLLTI